MALHALIVKSNKSVLSMSLSELIVEGQGNSHPKEVNKWVFL
jgi:hypothetical protein